MSKLLLEGLLIVFSVLFALYINRLSEQSKVDTRKEIAITRIQKELSSNKKIIEDWKVKHAAVKERLINIVADPNDSLRLEILASPNLDLGKLTEGNNLVDAVLMDVAWETAKSTGIIEDMDYELVEKFTHAYSLQNHFYDKTLMKILDIYFSKDAHNKAYFDAVMFQFQIHFIELVGQEHLLSLLYDTALNKIEEQTSN